MSCVSPCRPTQACERMHLQRGVRTSLISSTAKYASVGIPTVSGRTSTMTMTGLEMYRLNRSLIS